MHNCTYRIASNNARALIYFVHPLDPALIFFIRYSDPALFFLFTTLTGTFLNRKKHA